MKIATWNINGVKARIDNLVTWLKECDPDVACLQEAPIHPNTKQPQHRPATG